MAFENIYKIDLATSGASYTITDTEMSTSSIQRYRVFGTRVGFQLTTSGTMYEHNTVKVVWNGTPTGVVDILGTTMPSNIQAKDCLIEAVYNGSSWDVYFDTSSDQTGFIVDADISATAAIQRSKLAVGTADHVVINSGTGAFSSEAQLANTRGGTGQDSSAFTGVAKVAAGTWSASTLVNADVAAGAAIAVSKLEALNTGQIVAGNAGVPTVVTMSGDATISATGVVTIPDLMLESGAGTDSLKDLRATTSSGDRGTAFGDSSVNTGDDSQVFGTSAANAANNSTAIGPVATNTGLSGQAFGHFSGNEGDYGQSIGYAAYNRIDKSTNISGPIFIRKSDAQANVDTYQYMAGAEVVFMTEQIDATGTDVATITMPTGVLFFLTECGTIATSANTVAVEPTISFGVTGNNSFFAAAAITTALTAAGTRERITALSSDTGITSLTAEITVAATATTLLVRHYFKGYIVESQ